MEIIAGQGLLLLYSFMTLMLVPADTGFVAAFLIAAACASAVRLNIAQKRGVLIIVFFAGAACFFPKLLLFLPVMLYSILECRKYMLGIFLGGLCVYFYGKSDPEVFAFLLTGCLLSGFLAYQEQRYRRLEERFRRTRDDSRELNLLLEERNQSLLKRQDDEIYTAKLKERNRIAREIHDHVGHMLSRAILMTGAMKAVNRDGKMTDALDQLEDTLNAAMTNVRESVHDLHDDSVNLKEELTALVDAYTFCEAGLTYDMGCALPREVRYGFTAIVKEALNNVSKHSGATKVTIVAREHPGLYQLIIEDNGSGSAAGDKEDSHAAGDRGDSRAAGERMRAGIWKDSGTDGMGLRNMRDRVHALGGTIQISDEGGFRIHITVPKKEGTG